MRERDVQLDGSVSHPADEVGEIEEPARQPGGDLAAGSFESGVCDPARPLGQGPGLLEARRGVGLEDRNKQVGVEAEGRGSHRGDGIERLRVAVECGHISDDVAGQPQAQDGLAALGVVRGHLDHARADEMSPATVVSCEIQAFTGHQSPVHGAIHQSGAIPGTQRVEDRGCERLRHEHLHA